MITNDVSRESCVNIVLAAGGSAICAEDCLEVEEITELADGLCLNLGMPTEAKAEAMKLALQKAKEKKIPVLLDPVGVGASRFRNRLVQDLLSIGGITCIRGNAGEIGSLCHKSISSRGVETAEVELTEENLRELSERTGALIMASGKTDYLVKGSEIRSMAGGGEIFTRITGSGCMQSALLTAFLASYEDPWEGLLRGVEAFDAAGHIAKGTARGTGSFQVDFPDAICNLQK